MKKSFLKLQLLLLLFVIGQSSIAQTVLTVNARNLSAAEPLKLSADFSADITLRFTNNTANSDFTIMVNDQDGGPQRVKKGISAAEAASFDLLFKSNDHRLSIKKQNNNLISGLQDIVTISYGNDKVILLTDTSNTGGRPGTGDPAPTPKVGGDAAPGGLPLVTGIELHDAISAYRFYSNKQEDSLLYLLGKLKKLPDSVLTNNPNLFNLLLNQENYKNNPFISDLLIELRGLEVANIQSNTPPQKNLFQNLISKVGGLDVTNIADGFARFLVKRAKEELNVAFFQRFKDLINDPEYKDAQILFPKTLEILNSIDQDIYRFENYITGLREAFEKDLASILNNMPKVVEEGRFKDYFNAHTALKYSTLLALFTSQELLNGSHPGNIVADLPESYIKGLENDTATINVAGSIRSIQLMSASLRARGGDHYWASIDTLRLLVQKNDRQLIAAKFYLGLLYENSAGIRFKQHTLAEYLKDLRGATRNIPQYMAFVQQLGQYCQNAEKAADQIKQKPEGESGIDLYTRFFNACADVLEQVNKVGTLPGIDINDRLTADLSKYITIFRQATDLAFNIGHRNYSSAVTNAYNLYLRITELRRKETEPITDNKTLVSSVLPEDDTKTTEKLTADNRSTDRQLNNKIAKQTGNFIKKYGNLMSNVAKAKTSEEVAAAIEAAALPVGSYSIKRRSKFNISLNSYVGLFVGHEKIRGVDSAFKPNSFGITAPIGIAISTGLGRNSKSSSSLSLFVSLIDLGAPVSFRFKDDKTESVPTIQLKDIFSPGVFVSVGIPRTPLAFGVGWQMGPVLRKIDASVAAKAASNYSRVSLTLAVDIPLLNFSNNQ
jgi:hypothetical protein